MRVPFLSVQASLLVLWIIFPALPWWLVFMPLLIPAVFAGSVVLFFVSVIVMATLLGSVEYVSSTSNHAVS